MKSAAQKAQAPMTKRDPKKPYTGTVPGVVGPGNKPAGKKKLVPFKKKGKKKSGPKIQG